MRIRFIGVIACLALLSALAFALAAHSRTEALAFFDRSSWRPPVECENRNPPIGGSGVVDLVPISDTTFAALFAVERELMFYDRKLAPIRSLVFPKDGPRGVRNPVSAAVGDTLVFVADDATATIRKFDFHGADRGTLRLQFLPRRVRLSDENLVITPFVAGGAPANLLFTADETGVRAARVPITSYPDPGINAFANMAVLVAFPGRTVLMHEFVVPFGYVVTGARQSKLQHRFPVPLAAEASSSVTRLPKPPITEKNVNDFAVIAFAAAPARGTGSTFYVTRIGNGRSHPYRKLLVELDRNMDRKSVMPINADPHHMVYVANPPAIIGVNAEDNWFECTLP